MENKVIYQGWGKTGRTRVSRVMNEEPIWEILLVRHEAQTIWLRMWPLQTDQDITLRAGFRMWLAGPPAHSPPGPTDRGEPFLNDVGQTHCQWGEEVEQPGPGAFNDCCHPRYVELLVEAHGLSHFKPSCLMIFLTARTMMMIISVTQNEEECPTWRATPFY